MFREDPRPVLVCGAGKTKQEFKDECDVELIVARFKRTGMVDHLQRGVPQFMDVSEVGTYRELVERMREAEAYFLGLPAEVRARFENDPARYVELLAGESGPELEELRKQLFPTKEEREASRKAKDAERAPEPEPAPVEA